MSKILVSDLACVIGKAILLQLGKDAEDSQDVRDPVLCEQRSPGPQTLTPPVLDTLAAVTSALGPRRTVQWDIHWLRFH